MLKVDEIQTAIESLPEDEYAHLRRWFLERDWEVWDREIEVDSTSGRLEFLIEEALEEEAKGKLRDLVMNRR